MTITTRRTSRLFASGAVALALACSQACAQVALVGPPVFPRQFDRATVENLVNGIEQGENAIILEFGYFSRRTKQDLPAAEGLGLLRAKAAQEANGSKKWFLLHSVRAFGALNAGPETHAEAFATYGEIFAQASKAKESNAVPIVQRAISDYVFCVLRLYRMRVGAGQPAVDLARADDLVAQALEAHFLLVQSAGEPELEPVWAEAVKRMENSKPVRAAVEKALAQPEAVKSFAVLRTAAAIYSVLEPQRAIELLKQAKPLLAQPDSRDGEWLNTQLVRSLLEAKKVDEAIVQQQDFIRQSGRGRPFLAELQWHQSDWKGLGITLDELARPDTAEPEIVNGAAFVLSHKKTEAEGENARTKAAGLLAQYLAATRPRKMESELRARILLANYYLTKQQKDKAKEVLDLSQHKPPFESRAAGMLYRQAAALRASLG